MEERSQINLEWSIKDLIAFMSEGNPGGLNAMLGMLHTSDVNTTVHTILIMDDMNIRGPQIWVALKCSGSVEELMNRIKNRDAKLVEQINEDMGEDYPWKATTSGGSLDRSKFYEL